MAAVSRLEDKVALVTGAGSGIGRASSLRFAAEGAKVLCADIDTQAAEGTVALISEAGGAADSVGLDVTDSSQMDAAIAQAVEQFGKLNVLFNNAGIANADWQPTIDVNLPAFTLALFEAQNTLLPTVVDQSSTRHP